MAQIIETATGTVEKVDVDPVTLDLIENGCATPATRWTRCSSGRRCRRASASSTTSSR